MIFLINSKSKVIIKNADLKNHEKNLKTNKIKILLRLKIIIILINNRLNQIL